MIWTRLAIASSVLVLLGFASADKATGQSSRELIPKSEQAAAIKTDGDRPLPLLSGGKLLSVEVNRTPEPVLWAVDANGRPEEVRFTIPGASYVLVHGMAATADGTLVVHGSTYDNNSRGGSFLSIIAPDRSKSTVVRLVPYYPRVLTIAQDGTIWMIGYDESRRQHNVLKRFDPAGKVISSRDLDATGRISQDANEESTLRASGDRVGWLTNRSEYIEFSLDGQEMDRFQAPPWHPMLAALTTFAIDKKDTVIASVTQPKQQESLVWLLDRSRHDWVPLSRGKLEATSWMLGLDGNDVVFCSRQPGQPSTISHFSFAESK